MRSLGAANALELRTNALQEWADGAGRPSRAVGLCLVTLGACATHSAPPKTAAAPNAIGVNSYLWRATLDTLAFMPLASADPYGGVVITDWYTNPEKPDERFKCTVYILDTRLRGDALKVTVFKEVASGRRRLGGLAGGRPDFGRHRERHPDAGAPAEAVQPAGRLIRAIRCARGPVLVRLTHARRLFRHASSSPGP